jgi:hypothetical protein
VPERDENGIIHNEEFHTLYRSLNIFKVTKYVILKWPRNIAIIEVIGVLSKFY